MVLPLQVARRVGRYLLCDQIGSGGMATIHLARLLGPKRFSRTVAVKQLHPQFAQDPQFLAMFLDEARLAVRVRHGNVLSPLDIVVADSELFIVMDYVNGESLAWLLDAAAAPLPPSLAAAILVPVLLGLHAAHEATGEHGEPLGIVHRDVSPQNIMVGQDGVARVLDFGVAKAVARAQTTDEGMLKGKLGYMAPEQLMLQTVDRRTDVFTAGVVLWETLTGKRLFDGDAVGVSLGLILHGEISAPSRSNPAVTPELDAVVLKALARNRDERFASAMTMADALQRATPTASTLEMMKWIEALAGEELRRKAALVRRVEALDWEVLNRLEPSLIEDPPQPVPSRERSDERAATPFEGSNAAREPASMTQLWPDLLAVSTPANSDAPSPKPRLPTLVLTQPELPNPSGMGQVAMADSMGPVPEAQREPPAATNKRRDPLKSFAVASALLALVAALTLASLAREDGNPAPSLPVQHSPSSEPAASLDRPAVEAAAATLAPRNGSSLMAAPAAVRSPLPSTGSVALPTPASATVSTGVTSLPAAPAARTPARRARIRAARSADGKSTDGRSQRGGAPARTSMSPVRTSAECHPPWTFDEHNVKVFKRECLR